MIVAKLIAELQERIDATPSVAAMPVVYRFDETDIVVHDVHPVYVVVTVVVIERCEARRRDVMVLL